MSYFILPTQKLSIHTKKTPVEVLDSLKLQVDDYWYSDDELKFKKNKGFFVGEINGYKFNIRENKIRKAFIPLINGNIRGNDEGTIIDIAIGIHYCELIVGILTIILSSIIAPIECKLGVAVIFIFGLFGYKFERRKIINFLEKMLL